MHADKLLIISGPSGGGKTTVADALCAMDSRFEMTRSATTRMPRADGRDDEYIYLSESEFNAFVEKNGMLEYTEYGGNLYGTPRQELTRIFSRGKIPVLVLEFNGVRSLKSQSFDFDVISVYLYSTPDVVMQRLAGRIFKDGITDEGRRLYERRLAENLADYRDIMNRLEYIDAFVENNTVAAAINEVQAIVLDTVPQAQEYKNSVARMLYDSVKQ